MLEKNSSIKKLAIISFFLVTIFLVQSQYSKTLKSSKVTQIVIVDETINTSKNFVKNNNQKPTPTILARAEIISLNPNKKILVSNNEIIKIKLPPGKHLYNEQKMNETATDATIEILNSED
jgi:hypothetical protein